MANFLSNLFGGLGQQAPQSSAPMSVFDQARRQAAMQSVGQIGAQLMAMGMPMTAAQRAQSGQQLAQIMGNAGGNVLNNAQMLLAEKKVKDEEEARIAAAQQWAKISGIDMPAAAPSSIAAPQINTFGPRAQGVSTSQSAPSMNSDMAKIVSAPAPSGQPAAQPSAANGRLTPQQISYLMQAYPTDIMARNKEAAKMLYENSMPKKPEYKEVNGRLVEIVNGQSRVVMDLSNPVNAELYDRAKAAGLEPGTEEFQSFMLRGGAIAPETPEEINAKEFARLSAGSVNKIIDESIDAGMQANRTIAQVDRLGQLLATIPQSGVASSVKYIAGNLGIQTEGLSELQAAQALINSLVPAQRPPGSGPMSDADLELFKQSLPRLINTPEGNRIILETLRGIAEYDRQGGEIAIKMRTKRISEAEGYNQLMNRADPFANFQAPSIQQGAPQGGGINPEAQRYIDLYGQQ